MGTGSVPGVFLLREVVHEVRRASAISKGSSLMMWGLRLAVIELGRSMVGLE